MNRQLIDQDFAAAYGRCPCRASNSLHDFAGGIFGEGAGVVNQFDCSITLPAFAFSASEVLPVRILHHLGALLFAIGRIVINQPCTQRIELSTSR